VVEHVSDWQYQMRVELKKKIILEQSIKVLFQIHQVRGMKPGGCFLRVLLGALWHDAHLPEDT